MGKQDVKMSALGLGEEEDAESPEDSERFSARRPQKYGDRFSGATDQRGKIYLLEKSKDSTLERHLQMIKRGMMKVKTATCMFLRIMKKICHMKLPY